MYYILTVTKFFQSHGQRICQTDPILLLNIDETSSTCIKKYKVLVNQDFSFAPSVFDKDFSHATTILLFNVAGDSFEPFVILPNTNFDAFSSTRGRRLDEQKKYLSFFVFGLHIT